MHALDLDRAVGRFHRRVVPAVAVAAHGNGDSARLENLAIVAGPQRSSKRTLFCSRKLIHHQSQFLRAPTVLFASERGQGRAAFFAARRSKPLTLRSGEYAGEWLCAQQFRAHNHDDEALIPPSQVGQVYERKVAQFLRASRRWRRIATRDPSDASDPAPGSASPRPRPALPASALAASSHSSPSQPACVRTDQAPVPTHL